MGEKNMIERKKTEMKEGRKEWNEKFEKGINCIPYEFQDEKNSVKIKFIERRESMAKEVN